MVVNIAYKGEPVTFDIVVGCNVRVTTYKDNDRSVEVGVAPIAYGLKMTDGRGIVVRPPEACDGETTENGQVPSTLLPLIVTYEQADAPWLGLAYTTDDAFESPLSELKLFNATISKATAEEWRAWRETEGRKNFVTYELLGMNPMNRFDHPRWGPGKRFMATECQAFRRLTLPEPARELARRHWPANRPSHWYASDAAMVELRTVDDDEAKRKGLLIEGYPLEWHLGEGGTSFAGLPRRLPGALIFARRTVVSDVYPAWSDLSISRLDERGQYPAETLRKPKLIYAEVDVRQELKGFGYCDRVSNIDGLSYSAIGRLKYENRVNGEAINDQLNSPPTNPDPFFERDQYLYIGARYSVINV
ncbi:MAG: hypothetical protein IT537_30165 [Hyphomicrobiales bacterium]|nr:hypothetical protein [Hyphomicrobiales bacterium]